MAAADLQHGECVALNSAIARTAGAIIGAAGVIALAIGVWVTPWTRVDRSLVLLVLLLLAFVTVLVALNFDLDRRLKSVQASVSDLSRRAEEFHYEQALAGGLVALFYALNEPPGRDEEHHFTQIDEFYRIDGDDATYMFDVAGERSIEGRSHTLTMKISGDAPADANTLLLEATDRMTGESLEIRVGSDEPYLKVLHVDLSKPLERGEKFKVRISARWNGTFPVSRRSDYLFSIWGFYASHGIGKLSQTLTADAELYNVRLERLIDGRLEEAPKPKVTRDHGRCEIRWFEHSPSAIYLLRFDKRPPSD